MSMPCNDKTERHRQQKRKMKKNLSLKLIPTCDVLTSRTGGSQENTQLRFFKPIRLSWLFQATDGSDSAVMFFWRQMRARDNGPTTAVTRLSRFPIHHKRDKINRRSPAIKLRYLVLRYRQSSIDNGNTRRATILSQIK